VPLRPELQAIFDELMSTHPDGPSLDDVSDATWNRSLSYADIDELIGALEEAGVDLDPPEAPPRPEELLQVLTAARALSGEQGQRPAVAEIAARAGVSVAVVRRVLLLGRSIGASK
jgi:hypothetical protein